MATDALTAPSVLVGQSTKAADLGGTGLNPHPDYPLVLVVALDPESTTKDGIFRVDFHGAWSGRWVATARNLIGREYPRYIKRRRDAALAQRQSAQGVSDGR